MPDIMGKMDIAFPHLGLYLKDVPKSFSVFGFSVAMYGVIIGLGFLVALLIISKVAKWSGQNPDDYWDLAIYIIIFSIVGARLYYVIYLYKDQEKELLPPWRYHNVWPCVWPDHGKMGQFH